MTLANRLLDLVAVIGADIKSLRARLANVENTPANSPVSTINAATRLIHTQKIMAQMIARGQA